MVDLAVAKTAATLASRNTTTVVPKRLLWVAGVTSLIVGLDVIFAKGILRTLGL